MTRKRIALAGLMILLSLSSCSVIGPPQTWQMFESGRTSW